MTKQSAVTKYLSQIGNGARVPNPEECLDHPPREIKEAFIKFRNAYDHYVSLLVSLCLGDRKQYPRHEPRQRVVNDLPMVKDALPNHIEKERREDAE